METVIACAVTAVVSSTVTLVAYASAWRRATRIGLMGKANRHMP